MKVIRQPWWEPCPSCSLVGLQHLELYLTHSKPSKWICCPDKWNSLRTLGSGLIELRLCVCVCFGHLLFAPLDLLSALLHLCLGLRKLICIYTNGFRLGSAKGRHHHEIWGWEDSEVSVFIPGVPSLLSRNGPNSSIILMTNDNNNNNNNTNWCLLRINLVLMFLCSKMVW